MEDAVRCVPECMFINVFVYLSGMGMVWAYITYYFDNI